MSDLVPVTHVHGAEPSDANQAVTHSPNEESNQGTPSAIASGSVNQGNDNGDGTDREQAPSWYRSVRSSSSSSSSSPPPPLQASAPSTPRSTNLVSASHDVAPDDMTLAPLASVTPRRAAARARSPSLHTDRKKRVAESAPPPAIAPARSPTPTPTPAAAVPDGVADLAWLLPLMSGWELQTISAETHVFYTAQPSPKKGGRPRKTAARKTATSTKPMVTKPEEEENVGGASRDVFHVVLRHAQDPLSHVEFLVPIEGGGVDTNTSSASAAQAPWHFSVNLADPTLMVYDLANSRELSVRAMMQALLKESLRVLEATPTAVPAVPAAPTPSATAASAATATKAPPAKTPPALKSKSKPTPKSKSKAKSKTKTKVKSSVAAKAASNAARKAAPEDGADDTLAPALASSTATPPPPAPVAVAALDTPATTTTTTTAETVRESPAPAHKAANAKRERSPSPLLPPAESDTPVTSVEDEEAEEDALLGLPPRQTNTPPGLPSLDATTPAQEVSTAAEAAQTATRTPPTTPDATSPSPLPVKRGRGRPRRSPDEVAATTDEAATEATEARGPKPGRGRPRNPRSAEDVPTDVPQSERRSRGRPRKMAKLEATDAESSTSIAVKTEERHDEESAVMEAALEAANTQTTALQGNEEEPPSQQADVSTPSPRVADAVVDNSPKSPTAATLTPATPPAPTTSDAKVTPSRRRLSLLPPFTSLLAMEEALSSSLEQTSTSTSSQPPVVKREPHAVPSDAPDETYSEASNADEAPRTTTLEEDIAAAAKATEVMTLLDIFKSRSGDSASSSSSPPPPPSSATAAKSHRKGKHARAHTVPEDVPANDLSAPPPQSTLATTATVSEDAVPATATAPAHSPHGREPKSDRAVLAAPTRPRTTSELCFTGHRLPPTTGPIHALFDVEAVTNPRAAAATAARLHRRSTSPGRHLPSPSSGAGVAGKPPLPPSPLSRPSIPTQTSTVLYLAGLHSVRHHHGYALRRLEADHHLQRRSSSPPHFGWRVKTEDSTSATDAVAPAAAAGPLHQTSAEDSHSSRSSRHWRRWMRATRQEAARQEVRVWMREGLDMAVPSPRLRGDVLAAGIHALEEAERDQFAYVGHTDCTTTVRASSPTSPSTAETDASLLSPRVHLPGLQSSSSSSGASDGVPDHLRCLIGSLCTGGHGNDHAAEADALCGFPRRPPSEFLPVSGFALLQSQERIAPAVGVSSLYASTTTTTTTGAPATTGQSRCTLCPEGIPSAPTMTISNTFRTHGPLCVVPALPSQPTCDTTTTTTSGTTGAVQHVLVPNPFQDVAYYVHRRFLSHRLREEVDLDGVLAITSDGVYPDTEAVKALKKGQLNALVGMANAAVHDDEALNGLQHVALSALHVAAADANTAAIATSAQDEDREATSAEEASPSDVASPVTRGPIDDSEAVGDQVDRMLRRGHDIQRVPMPNVEWSYGPI